MAAADQNSQDKEASDFVAEVTSTFEPILIEKVCQPVLQRLPRSIHPNSISLLNHLVNWVVVWLAILSPSLGPIGQPLALVLAGLGVFATMVMDCLDGMQARRTGRCSKLGELLDHWLDAIHVPLVSVGIVMALQLHPWGIAAVVITSAMVYNAQLVLYHHRGVYLHPPTSGADAVAGVSGGYLIAAVVLSLVSRQTRWLDLVLIGVAVIATVTQSRLCLFYYRRLGRLLTCHLRFVGVCLGWAALYLAGAIDAVAFVLAITFTSFRITGSYVLYSILKRPYSGIDWGLAVWIAVIAAAHLIGGPVERYAVSWLAEPVTLGGHTFVPRALLPYMPYLTLVYIVARNLFELFAHFSELRPAPPATERETAG